MDKSHSGSSTGSRPAAVTAAGLAVAATMQAANVAIAAEPSPGLAAIFQRIPAKSPEGNQEIGEALVAGGAETVRELVRLVGPEFGDSAGAMPKQALHALVIYASRPGSDKPRSVVAETLAKELDADHSDELKAFIVRQLQLCGRDQEVSSLARLLESDRLCEPATQALLAIGGSAATNAIKAALPKATGGRKITLSQAVDLTS